MFDTSHQIWKTLMNQLKAFTAGIQRALKPTLYYDLNFHCVGRPSGGEKNHKSPVTFCPLEGHIFENPRALGTHPSWETPGSVCPTRRALLQSGRPVPPARGRGPRRSSVIGASTILPPRGEVETPVYHTVISHLISSLRIQRERSRGFSPRRREFKVEMFPALLSAASHTF